MRLLLIEDDELISRELGLRWRGRQWSVQACTRLAQAETALAEAAFDLIVLDLGLPDGNGLHWLAQLRQRDRLTPVLVLTARDSINDRVAGLKKGADDYLVKPFAVDELDARAEVLCRRGNVARGALMQYGHITWLGDQGLVLVNGKKLEVSPREFEVLGLLLRRAPKLVAKRTLVEALAERNEEVGESAAELYVSRLRRKLVGSGTAIQTLRGFGYMLVLEAGA